MIQSTASRVRSESMDAGWAFCASGASRCAGISKIKIAAMFTWLKGIDCIEMLILRMINGCCVLAKSDQMPAGSVGWMGNRLGRRS